MEILGYLFGLAGLAGVSVVISKVLKKWRLNDMKQAAQNARHDAAAASQAHAVVVEQTEQAQEEIDGAGAEGLAAMINKTEEVSGADAEENSGADAEEIADMINGAF